MKKKKKESNFKRDRPRMISDDRTDVYRKKQKYKEPTRCPQCGSLFTEGRWNWENTSAETYEAICPACRRINDRYPAGFVDLGGPFFVEHKTEIMHMIRNLEEAEKAQHPLERIMDITKESDDGNIITTTGMHLARHIGDALKHAYQGDLDISYDSENYVRINWHR